MVRYDNTTQTSPETLRRLANGDSYAVGKLFTGVADTNTKKLMLQSLSDDTALLVFEPTVRGSGQFYTRKVENVTVDTNGDSATVANKRTGESGPSAANTLIAGDNETGVVSGGTDLPQITAGSGSNRGNADPGESGSQDIANIVDPNDNLVVEVQNQSGGAQDFSLTTDFLEVPTSKL
jgi:membrane-bound inhibitor of C-type lysozyme